MRIDKLIEANRLYRLGQPSELSDAEYDELHTSLLLKFPDHPFFEVVEEEPELIQGKRTKLPKLMLSTNKAYTHAEIQKWFNQLLKLNATSKIIVTPKFDGYAGYFDGTKLYTRGNGVYGTDISHVLNRNIVIDDIIGPGEIVVDSEYFREHLSKDYSNTRNFIASVIKESEPDDIVKMALNDGAVHFVSFEEIKKSVSSISQEDLARTIDDVFRDVRAQCVFDTDGIVLEFEDETIKSLLGHNDKYHKWQIAYKQNNSFVETTIVGITNQTGRTGRITPVAELEPAELDGVIISNVTCNNHSMVKKLGLGPGAIVSITRSGGVIPKIVNVVKKSKEVNHPESCPSCGHQTIFIGELLYCSNTIFCSAQIENTLSFFFNNIEDVDGFGPAVIKILSKQCLTLPEILTSTTDDFISYGISNGIAKNLYDQLQLRFSIPIDSSKILASMGLPKLGNTNSKRLLENYSIDEIFDLTYGQLIGIGGFGSIIAVNIIDGLKEIKELFPDIHNLFTIKALQEPAVGQLTGKTIVFTGKLLSGSRKQLAQLGETHGAIIGSAVNKTTDYLVIGQNVGTNKTSKAEKLGTEVITEEQFLEMLK